MMDNSKPHSSKIYAYCTPKEKKKRYTYMLGTVIFLKKWFVNMIQITLIKKKIKWGDYYKCYEVEDDKYIIN